MTDNRIYYSKQIYPTNQVVPTTQTNSTNALTTSGETFTQVLSQELGGVKFSQHALQRLQSRNIKLDATQLAQLNDAVAKVAQKGAKESLVLMNNNLALVVSVKNKTVITAIDGASIKNNVFTNIDSAVIV